METNESILTRSIVGLDERKVLGKIAAFVWITTHKLSATTSS